MSPEEDRTRETVDSEPKHYQLSYSGPLMSTLNTKTHSSKEMAEFSFRNSEVKSICYCKQRMKTKLSLSSECVVTKLCKPCTSFTSHLHSSCGMVWYRTLRLMSQQQASVSQGRICLDNFTCCHTEIEVADQNVLPHPVTVY